MRSLKKIFWAGLVSLIALWLIFNLFKLLYDFLFLKPLRDVLSLIIRRQIPGLEFVVGLAIILILGLLAQQLSRRAPSKIPIIDKIIKFSKIAHKFGNRLDKGEIKSVIVRVNETLYLLGFTTGESIKINEQEMVIVLLPSTPNPTTGYSYLVPKEKVIYLPPHLNKFVLETILTAGLLK